MYYLIDHVQFILSFNIIFSVFGIFFMLKTRKKEDSTIGIVIKNLVPISILIMIIIIFGYVLSKNKSGEPLSLVNSILITIFYEFSFSFVVFFLIFWFIKFYYKPENNDYVIFFGSFFAVFFVCIAVITTIMYLFGLLVPT